METREPEEMPPPPERWLRARSDDGSYNDLSKPAMGMAGTRFGRNCDRDHSRSEDSERQNEAAFRNPNAIADLPTR